MPPKSLALTVAVIHVKQTNKKQTKNILVVLEDFSLKKSDMYPNLSQTSSNQHSDKAGYLRSHY